MGAFASATDSRYHNTILRFLSFQHGFHMRSCASIVRVEYIGMALRSRTIRFRRRPTEMISLSLSSGFYVVSSIYLVHKIMTVHHLLLAAPIRSPHKLCLALSISPNAAFEYLITSTRLILTSVSRCELVYWRARSTGASGEHLGS